MKRIMLFLGVFWPLQFLFGQTAINQPELAPTAGNLREAFKKGAFKGSFRTFFMATDNARELSDYYAWAAGGNLHFNSAPLHGFSFGLGGGFNTNLSSSNLAARDSITGAINRYEIGLFDVQNPANRKNLDRLEEFYLRYQGKKTRLTLGQQFLQTPFINAQDGRMRPTAESGLWLELHHFKKIQIEGGWIWSISPRSTVEWFSIGESIGLYPKGLNPDGSSSGYQAQLKSKGIALLGLTKKWGTNTKLQVWDQMVEQIFNTAFLQFDHTQPLKKGHKWIFGAQFTHQNALKYGGHEDKTKTYFTKGGQSSVISTQTGWERAQWRALLAYTHITADGRFLAPREWGREPFYTFMPRERIEGSGKTHALSARILWQNPAKRFKIEAAYGHFYLPDVLDLEWNKYAFPAYNQFNFDARYSFSGILEGLRVQLLYVRKGRLGNVYGQEKYVINKVQMSQLNVVLNYMY